MAVYNVRDLPDPWPNGVVYIGRNPEIWRRSGGNGPPAWGNPFVMKVESDRPRVIAAYTRWLADRIAREPRFKAEVVTLAGRDLACHCAPRACHGHVLEDAARTLAAGRVWTGTDLSKIQASNTYSPTPEESHDTRIMRAALIVGLPNFLKSDPSPEAVALREAYRALSLAMKAAGRLERTPDGAWKVNPTAPPTPETRKTGLATIALQRTLVQAVTHIPEPARSPLARTLLEADAQIAKAYKHNPIPRRVPDVR